MMWHKISIAFVAVLCLVLLVVSPQYVFTDSILVLVVICLAIPPAYLMLEEVLDRELPTRPKEDPPPALEQSDLEQDLELVYDFCSAKQLEEIYKEVRSVWYALGNRDERNKKEERFYSNLMQKLQEEIKRAKLRKVVNDTVGDVLYD